MSTEDLFIGMGLLFTALMAALARRASPYSPSLSELLYEPVDASNVEATDITPRFEIARINEHHAQVAEFMRRVMYLDPEEYFLSDESTIENIQRGHENGEYFRRTRNAYGVDVSDITPPYLWAIAERIQERRNATVDPSVPAIALDNFTFW